MIANCPHKTLRNHNHMNQRKKRDGLTRVVETEVGVQLAEIREKQQREGLIYVDRRPTEYPEIGKGAIESRYRNVRKTLV